MEEEDGGGVVEGQLFQEEAADRSAILSSGKLANPEVFLAKPDEENKELRIRVTAPEKVGEGLMNAHVEYKLHVKTVLADYKQNEFEVVRRYKDFVWLREQLVEHHKGYLIPPLPEKAVLNRFSAEFMEYRRHELERFLYRVAVHSVLRCSSFVKKFLEAESSEALTSATKQKKESSSGGGILSFLGSSVESLSGMNFGSQSEPDHWFDAKKNYIAALETQLTGLAKAANTICRRQKELSQGYSELGLAASLLASSEADQDQYISESYNKLFDVCGQISALDTKTVDSDIAFFEESIRDYIRIIGAVKEMLQARNEKLAHYQNATKQLEMKKEKNKNGKEIEEAQRKVEETQREFNDISEICKMELQRFDEMKHKDMKLILVKLTQINMNHGLQVVNSWKEFLTGLQNDENEIK